MESTFTDSLIT